jgi:hypothetical protein
VALLFGMFNFGLQSYDLSRIKESFQQTWNQAGARQASAQIHTILRVRNLDRAAIRQWAGQATLPQKNG